MNKKTLAFLSLGQYAPFFLMCFMLLFSTVPPSYASSLQQPQTFHGVTAQLVPDVETAKAGEPFNAIWQFHLKDDWHVYWKNPGDVGLPYVLNWQLPSGWRAGGVDWPTPKPFATPKEDPIVMSYGYADEILLATPIHIPTDAIQGRYPIRLQADFLICEEICLPLSETFEAIVTVDDELLPNAPLQQQLTQQPKPIRSTDAFTVGVTGATLKLAFSDGISLQKGDVFIPAFEGLIDDLAPQTFDTTTHTLTLVRDTWADAVPTRFAGLVLKEDGSAVELTSQAIPAIPFAEEERPEESPSLTLWLALGFAFVAGVILNIMPCVLPVLTLKLFSLFQHTEKRLHHAASYAVGVLTCFSGLGLLLVGLKQAGMAVGWGFHLQSPTFVLGMALFLCGIAYTFWRDIPLPALFRNRVARLKDSLAGSFGLGVLITLLATPCTVPFMGGAIAFALTAPAFETLAVLWAMGAGMAVPFVVLALLPHPPRIKSKHVAWVKPVLAVPVLLTAVWLFSVWLKLAGVVQAETAHGWNAWTPETWEQALVDTSRPTLLNATADWCLTCKVTEQRVFETNAFQTWAETQNIRLLEADWTRQDADIAALLQSFGREGVPLYVLVQGGEVSVLPQFPGLGDFVGQE